MKKRTCWIVLAGMILAVFTLLPVSKALADLINGPDTPPTITSIHVNQSLYQSGDALVYAIYDLPYFSEPAVSASQTYIFRLMDGTTELGNTTAFQNSLNGYNYGIISFYFPPSSGFTFGSTNYSIQIAENPTAFSYPVDWNFTIPSSAYSSFTDQIDNQTQLAQNLYTMGLTIQNQYGEIFFQESGTSQEVLTSDGENYFLGVISGLEALCPQIFFVSIAPEDTTATAWTTAQFDEYDTRFQGTWVGDIMTATANQFGGTANGVMCVIVIIISVAVLGFSGMKFKRIEPGLMCVCVILMWGVLMGWMPKPIFALVFQLTAIYEAYLLFYTRGEGAKLVTFLGTCWLLSTLICLVMEGQYFGSSGGLDTNSIINNLSVISHIPVGNLFNIPVFNVNFFDSIFKMLTWDYSFYQGGYVIFRLLFICTLSAGAIWEICTAFIWLYSAIVSLFRISPSSV